MNKENCALNLVDEIILSCIWFCVDLRKGYTNLVRLVHSICLSSVWNLLRAAVLEPLTLKWRLDFLKACAPQAYTRPLISVRWDECVAALAAGIRIHVPSFRATNVPCIGCIFLIHLLVPRYLNRYSDSLRAGRSGDRIPVRAGFSAPVQTGPGAHPASYTIGTGSFPGVKRPGRGFDHPPHLASRLKKE